MNLKIGLDFISGGSNVVGEHVQLCLNRAKEELGMIVAAPETLIVAINKHRGSDL